MDLKIEREAAKVLLNVLLSCKDPIREDLEKKLIDYFLSKKNERIFDFQKMVTIAEESGSDTGFHRLRDFCLYSKNDLDEVIITREDVYRHFCSTYHWKVVEDSLVSSYKSIINIPTWFVGHMLLPVKLKKRNKATYAEYSFSNLTIDMQNVFVPPEFKVQESGIYAIHFASIVSEINPAVSRMMNQQLESVNRFIEFRKDIGEIDYTKFQRFGDYSKFCQERYLKYF